MFETDFYAPSGTVLALGSFDGLHLGHAEILENAKQTALRNGLLPAVMLFDVHPRLAIDGTAPPALISADKREKLLTGNGFGIVKVDFDAIRGLSPREFILLLKEKLCVKAVCCGFNYRYGKNGSGSAETLRQDCAQLGIQVSVGEPVMFEGGPVSSTRIRSCISCGDIERANAMLGRAFSYELEVVEGDERGRLMGFPTINQFFELDFIIPRFGVYASTVTIDGTVYPAATNIGVRPTIGTGFSHSETHIIGFDGDLYHKNVEVSLLRFLRDEMDCGSLENLICQLKKDVALAKAAFDEISAG